MSVTGFNRQRRLAAERAAKDAKPEPVKAEATATVEAPKSTAKAKPKKAAKKTKK